MLSANKGMKALVFEEIRLVPPGVELLADALKENVPLELLELGLTESDIASACSLCGSLEQTKL